jgi:hypothetical protein
MLVFQMLSWWYGQGWRRVAVDSQQRLVTVSHIFSVPILLRTLFAPWRRIVTYPGAGLDAKLRALGDNLVSRAVGFSVRIMVLVAAGLILGLTASFGIVFVLLWPLLPVAIPALLLKGVIG